MEDRMNRMYQRSYLGRSMDPAYPNHRAILILSVVAGVAGGMLRLLAGSSLLDAAFGAFYAGASVFIAWVLARELDPDYEASAFVGAVLAFFAWLVFGNPALIPLYLMILSLRMVNRTVGPALKLGDSVVIFVAVLLAVFLGGGWVYGVIAAFAFLQDTLLVEPHRRHYYFAALSLLASLVAVLAGGFEPFEMPSVLYLGFTVLAGLMGFLLIIMIRKVETVGDFSKQPLNLTRVRAGIFFAVFAVLAVLWFGDGGVVALAPLSAALIGSAIYHFLPLTPKP